MSAGPVMKTYASASFIAAHSWEPTCPCFAFGSVAADRQNAPSSSNVRRGRAPRARAWYTNSVAIGRPWFHVSTITFSPGFRRRVFLRTFFARVSYSDIDAPPNGEPAPTLNAMARGAFARCMYGSLSREGTVSQAL